MNLHGIWAIYRTEMARALRTVWQSVATPVITTSLYFVVFGGAIGSRMKEVGGVGYGSFIVPGLIMLSLLTQSISNASIGIYFPKFIGTIYELLSAPVTAAELVIGYVGAAATKSVVLGLLILATACLFVPIQKALEARSIRCMSSFRRVCKHGERTQRQRTPNNVENSPDVGKGVAGGNNAKTAGL